MKLESLAQSIPLVSQQTLLFLHLIISFIFVSNVQSETTRTDVFVETLTLSYRGLVAVTLPRRLCRMWMTGI